MICGLPIIANEVGGIPEIIQDQENGLLQKPEDTKALSKNLAILIKNPTKRINLAKKSQATVINNFPAKKMAEAYEKVYQKILSTVSVSSPKMWA